MFVALLDTCVLWPSLQRDFLLSLAIEGTYRPVWSRVILDELEYEERRKLIGRGVGEAEAIRRAQHLVRQMRSAFAEAEVAGWEPLEGTFGLPDPADEHLAAAADRANAGAIVTYNVRDLPATKLPEGLKVLKPHEFAANTAALHTQRARSAVTEMAKRSGKSGRGQSEEEILEILAKRYGLTEAVEILREAAI